MTFSRQGYGRSNVAIRFLSGLMLIAGWAAARSSDMAVASPLSRRTDRDLAQDVAPTDQSPRSTVKSDARAEATEKPELFRPARPLTPAAQQQIDAKAWFMKGRLHESREEFREALAAYEKSIDLDPTAGPVYRALIPLAFGLNEQDRAIKYALKAIELAPDDVDLLQRVGIHLATKEKVPEALQLLEQAAKSKKLDRQSGRYVTVMRDLGLLYLITSQMDKAADAFEVVLDAKINHEKYHLDFQTRQELEKHQRTTFEAIGQVFLDAKRPERAIVALERAAKGKKTKPGSIAFSLAQAYVLTDKYDQALEHLQTYFDAQLQSKGKAAYQLLAEILKQQNKSNDLLPQLEKMAEADQHNHTLQFFLARQYVEAKRYDDAEKLFKKTLERERSIEGFAGLAALYREQKRPAELLQALGQALSRESEIDKVADDLEHEMQAIQKDEEFAASLLAVGQEQITGDSPKLDFGGSLMLAKIAASLKKFEPAEAFYRFAIKLRRDRTSNLFDEFGRVLLDARLFADSARIFREAATDAALKESRPQFLFFLSQAEEMGGNTDAALAAVAEAAKIIPNNPLIEFQEAWIYYHAHNWDKAVPLYEAFITKFTGKNERLVRQSQFSLSNIHVQRGDIRKGEEILERVLVETPDDPSVNNDLGYLYADQGKNLEKAHSMIAKAIKAEPDNAAYQDSMGWVLFKLGKLKEALPFLEKAVQTPRGSDATIFDHLGDVHQQLGDKAKAVENWQRAVKDAKDDKTPDQKLIEKLEEKLKKAQ